MYQTSRNLEITLSKLIHCNILQKIILSAVTLGTVEIALNEAIKLVESWSYDNIIS